MEVSQPGWAEGKAYLLRKVEGGCALDLFMTC
jgi:hypothetical protein